MQQMLKQAQKMQEQLRVAQEELANASVEGSAGGGLVTATVSGVGEIVGITISPAAVDPDDVETLSDLVTAAVRDAQSNAHALQEETMGPLTAGIPGLGF